MKPTYSSHVHHPLNRSPSKTSYHFGKAPRFPEAHPEHTDPSYLPVNSQPPHPQPQYLRSSPSGRTKTAQGSGRRSGRSRSPQEDHLRHDNVKPTIDYIEKIRARAYLEGGGRDSPYKPHCPQPNKSSSRYEQPYDYQYSPMSPKSKLRTKKQSPPKVTATKSRSPKKSPSPPRKHPKQRSPSPGRAGSPSRRRRQSPTMTQLMVEADHPCQNVTSSGYYPTGTEMSLGGKYVSSTMRNVSSGTFGRSDRFEPIRKENNTGPGAYQYFSEFGAEY